MDIIYIPFRTTVIDGKVQFLLVDGSKATGKIHGPADSI